MKTELSEWLALVMACILGLFLGGYIGYRMADDELRLERPAKIEYQIHVVDGRADKTFIYKTPKP